MQAVDLGGDLAGAEATLVQTVNRFQNRLLFGHLLQTLARLAAGLVLDVTEAIGR